MLESVIVKVLPFPFRFTVPVSDVLRLLLPDVVVLLCSTVAVIVNLKVVNMYRKAQEEGGTEGTEEGDGEEREDGAESAVAAVPTPAPPAPNTSGTGK